MWNWFASLHQERQFSDMGTPRPLSSEQIRAWQGLNGVDMSAFELRAIRKLDEVYLNAQQSAGERKRK